MSLLLHRQSASISSWPVRHAALVITNKPRTFALSDAFIAVPKLKGVSGVLNPNLTPRTLHPIYLPARAGLGRAPATALAYMYWCCGMALQDAISTFMAVRPCNPRIAAIRAATTDILLDGGRRTPVTIAVHRPFSASRFQVEVMTVLNLALLQSCYVELDTRHGTSPLRTLEHLPPG